MSEITEDSPELRQDISDAAGLLLPIAQCHVDSGKWPLEVAAWLIMVRDSFDQVREGVQ
jgi:hypothetical protein